MLVLSRLKNEVICIGDDVEVMVVEIRGDKVRLGVKAPDNVEVDRREVRDAKERNGRRPENQKRRERLVARMGIPQENSSCQEKTSQETKPPTSSVSSI